MPYRHAVHTDPQDAESTASGATRFRGLFRRGSGWRLTRRGWAVALLGTLFVAALFLRGIHPFLAVNKPAEPDVLVVEGWVADYAINAAVREFSKGDYSAIYVTGGPLDRGAPLAEYKTYAALGTAVAVHFGAPTNRIQAVPTPKVRRDRTYASALALRDWLEKHDAMPAGLNLVTIGPHARRSRLLYEKAFGDGCEIGVIAVAHEDYDPRRWWAYSTGFRTIMSETAAYLYARVFFRISADRRAENEKGEDPVESSP